MDNIFPWLPPISFHNTLSTTINRTESRRPALIDPWCNVFYIPFAFAGRACASTTNPHLTARQLLRIADRWMHAHSRSSILQCLQVFGKEPNFLKETRNRLHSSTQYGQHICRVWWSQGDAIGSTVEQTGCDNDRARYVSSQLQYLELFPWRIFIWGRRKWIWKCPELVSNTVGARSR